MYVSLKLLEIALSSLGIQCSLSVLVLNTKSLLLTVESAPVLPITQTSVVFLTILWVIHIKFVLYPFKLLFAASLLETEAKMSQLLSKVHVR